MYPELSFTIDGRAVTAAGRRCEPVVNPATGETLGLLPFVTEADLDRALASAQRAFMSWKDVPARNRAVILKRAAELMRTRVDHIARVLTLEQGKTLAEARTEILTSADIIEWYAEEGRRAYGRVVPSSTPGTRQLVVLEPVGVTVAMTPWNFPALTPCRKIGAALAAGCSVILKPSEETPGTAIEIARALHDAGLPAGLLNLVCGDPAGISARLLASPFVRKLSFTGSVEVGKRLMGMAAAGLQRTTLELGGHAPVLVFDDVDVERVADVLALGKFRNAGQICISPTRFYIHEAIFELFAQRFAARANALRLGNGLGEDTTMGPLANARRVAAMDAFVADASARGARLRAGGHRVETVGHFFEPTVLSDPPDDARVMTEEPFGPVVPLTRFRTFDEVIERANSLPFGLAAYAFTTSNETALTVGDALKCGMVGVNTLSISTPETPFGGVGQSGHGQEGGVEGLQAYLDVKFIAHARTA
jgi:succinate-semialdehyde dehydrogenase / glutarate-semialdehyde dehydrogenase